MTRDDTLAWVSLSRAPALDAATLATALETLGGAVGVMHAPDPLLAHAGLAPATRQFLHSAAAEPTALERRWLDSPSHRLMVFVDPDFPPLLRAAPDCPIALYVEGNAALLGEPQLAIVGSRNPTADGRDTARAFAAHLSRCGLVITSGLAAGIDAAAHRGALDASGATIAVLGTGCDECFPRSNAALAEQIAASGALVSEFSLGTPGYPANFPRRNRIIAGLSLGALVIEAARQSGSLITARLAGERGREVFAIPGSIHNPLKRGCHQLIRQGAKLTETADDILSELNFLANSTQAISAPNTAGSAAATVEPMDKDHEILLDALGFEPADLDALVVRTGFKPAAVASMMLILELTGKVRLEPGGRYSRVARSV
jgi:DNA processing protein